MEILWETAWHENSSGLNAPRVPRHAIRNKLPRDHQTESRA
tara:strand:- start:1177 stop:1299 length:123 start_codon:yes stop_codon:yes gene_type:complete